MKSGWVAVLALAMFAVLATLVLIAVRPGIACPAVGYVYVGDVELEFASEPDSVAACFGSECNPQPVMRSADGKWTVPQSSPYLLQDSGQSGTEMPGNVTSILIATVHRSGASVVRALAIQSEPTGEGRFWPTCPAPLRYLPVQVF